MISPDASVPSTDPIAGRCTSNHAFAGGAAARRGPIVPNAEPVPTQPGTAAAGGGTVRGTVRAQLVRQPVMLALLVLAAGACGSASTHGSAGTAAPSASTTPTEGPAPTTGVTDAYPAVAALQGTLTGAWTNSTFGTTGSMTWVVTADPTARTVTITVNVTGNAFGMPAPAPEQIELTHLAQGEIMGTSSAFGAVSGTVSASGAVNLTLSAPNSSVTSVAVTGSFAASSVSLNYTVNLAGGGSATGTVSLTKQ